MGFIEKLWRELNLADANCVKQIGDSVVVVDVGVGYDDGVDPASTSLPQRLLDGADRAEPDFGRVLAVASLGRRGGAACKQWRGELDDVAGVAAAQLSLDNRETVKRPQARRACSQSSRLYRNVPSRSAVRAGGERGG